VIASDPANKSREGNMGEDLPLDPDTTPMVGPNKQQRADKTSIEPGMTPAGEGETILAHTPSNQNGKPPVPPKKGELSEGLPADPESTPTLPLDGRDIEIDDRGQS